LTIAWVLACLVIIGPNYAKEALTNFEDAEVLAFRESRDGTLAVLQYRPAGGAPFQQLVVNGTSYANNGPPGRRYMSLLGHLPALLHPTPCSGLVIAIGTGTTAGSLTLHNRMEEIWAVDIAKDVFDLAPCFEPLNHHFTQSSRVRMVVADGRHFLLSTDRRFDVLTFEPPPPTEAGVVNLYSREFYQLAKRHMNPGAILCQWIPLDCGPEKVPRMMLKTLLAEFRHVSLWMPCRKEGVVIASDEPLRIDLEALRERMAAPRLAEDLKANGLREAEQLAATFLAADQDLAAFAGEVPLVTDNQPRIEYFHFHPGPVLRCAEILQHRQGIEEYLTRPASNPQRLADQRTVMAAICFHEEELQERDFKQAQQHLEQALRLDEGNEYLRFLRTQFQRTRATQNE
jgi:spermidine synthase